ncbi:MAG TPA: hypothetical protein DEQ61_07430 [Streptomyces sp.]|nr:hypothetical protein [Streptomyces sp.]
MPFPLDLRTELQIGGEWTEVTADVSTREPISISVGRTAQGSRTDPGSCSLTLNNRAGKYSPRNPRSPYYGLIGRNTPIRVSLYTGDSYLELDGDMESNASTPDAAVLDVTDLDVRFEASMDWNASGDHQTIIGRWEVDTLQQCWVLRVGDGWMRLSWSTDGTDAGIWSAAGQLPQLPRRVAIRVTLDVDNGTGGSTTNFYWAPTLDGPWEEMATSASITTGTTSIHPGTAPLKVAPSYVLTDGVSFRRPLTGEVHRAELRDGIDGAIIASPDFRDQDPGATSFVDSTGLTWTLTGTATITNRKDRFRGEVSSWPTRWDLSGTDVWVPIQAAGVLRRYGQGVKPLDSTLRRRIPTGDPIAYWPMEEGSDADRAYSPIEGIRPLTVTGLDWAADSSLVGSSALPKLEQAATIAAPIPLHEYGDGWHIEMVYFLEAMPGTLQNFFRIELRGSRAGYIQILVGSASVRIEIYDTDNTLISGFTAVNADAMADFVGKWNRFSVSTAISGGDTYIQVLWRDIIQSKFWYARTNFIGEDPGQPSSISGSWGADFQGMTIGHLGVFNTGASFTTPATGGTEIYAGADDGFLNDFIDERMERLSAEEGLPLVVHGTVGGILPRMGSQRPNTLLDLIQEAADVDGGILSEDAGRPGLLYRTRESLYSQTPALSLDYQAKGEVAPPLEPIDDDQGIRNDVTVKRIGGSAGRAVLEDGPLSVQDPPDGVGRYDESLDLNLYLDTQPEPIAYWKMHLGTWDEARYPKISVNLRAAEHLIPDVLDLQLGDKLTISNPPDWLPPDTIEQLVQGYTETLDLYAWDIVFNCTPAGPWNVAEVEDETYGHVDAEDTVLASDITTTADTIHISAITDPAWTTDPTDLPVDIRVGGEVMTVTAAAAATGTPMVADGDASETAATDHIAPSVTAPESADLLICSWIPWDDLGPYTLPASMTAQGKTNGVWSTLEDATEQLTASGATGTRTATLPGADAWAAMSVIASGTPVIEEHLAAVEQTPTAVSLTTASTTEAGWWLLAIQAWDKNDIDQDGGPSGSGWTLLADSGIRSGAAPYQTAYAKRAVGGAETVTLPAGNADDNHARIYVLSGVTDLAAQALTVTRSVNGIVKEHAAGTSVRLAQPAIVAL